MTDHAGKRRGVELFAGGGEMGALMRATDWSKTKLGPTEHWPQSLRTMLGVVLGSRFPMLLWWGPDLLHLYNDAYRPILRDKHPASLAAPAAEVWAEVWDVAGPMAKGVLEGGPATWTEDLQLFIKSGDMAEETYFTFSYSPVPGDDGKVGGLLNTVQETTAKVQGEREIRMLRDLAARAVDAKSEEDAFQIAVQVLGNNHLDLPFVLVYALSDEAKHARLVAAGGLDGYEGGARLSEIPVEGDTRRVWPLAEAIRSGGEVAVEDLETRFGPLPPGRWNGKLERAMVLPLLCSGQRRPCAFLVAGVSPHRTLDDRYRSFFRTTADHVANVIASARAHEAAKKRAETLAEIDHAKTTFFSNVSHEFRTPLTLILGPVEDALRLPAQSLTGKDLQAVHRSSLRLLRLVNSLLDFSRIEAGRLQLSFAPTDLATLTSDLASSFRSLIERAGLRFDVDCPPLPEPIYVDPIQWEKVVLNLVSNAFKFTHAGSITVTLRSSGDRVELRVADTGIGIWPQELPHIFERFHRVERAKGRSFEGTGIGLSLVRELVRLHGGAVDVSSTHGVGTTFVVSIPTGHAHLAADRIVDHAAPPPSGVSPYLLEAAQWIGANGGDWDLSSAAEQGHQARSAPEGPDRGRSRILVVDDNADMRAYLARLLGTRWHVDLAEDGQAALAAARERPPDLVISDVMMPRLDGPGLLRELHEDPATSHVPVVLLSARAGEESILEGFDTGADDYLVKPFSARELLARVQTHLELGGLRRETERALGKSQGLLQAISDNSSAVIYAKDLEGRYLLVNRRFCEVFNLSSDRVLGKTDHEVFAKDLAELFRSLDQRAIAADTAVTEEELVSLDDGGHTYISVRSPLRDGTGKPYGVFGISTDISDHKRAEETLRASEERTRSMIETSLDAMISIDTDGTITGWSAQAEQTFGWSRYEAIGRALAETVIPKQYREAHLSGLKRFLSTGEGVVLNRRLELSALHRDGHEFPVELTIAPVSVGHKTSFSAFVRDITDRKQMERALIESQQQYQALAESLPHLVWTCRPDGYCDFLSRQWVEYTGLSAEEQLGSGWVEQVHPDDRPHVQAAWARATERGDSYDVEFRIRRADGAYRWFKTRAVPLRDASGALVKWFGSNTDFEDYKQSEERLRSQLERLNLLDRLTRAISERQDLQSILQVVVRSLEDHLPVDFCCVCLYDRADESLTVTRVGVKSAPLALELAMPEKSRVSIDENGLARCVRGQFVYEPDIADSQFPFPRRLAGGGLRAFVAAPLLIESQVFGVLVAARRKASSFSSAECEFLRQLSEHVALAAHQAQLYTALQQAYDDLRQTQQAVTQQERLKALGQMASGIAHDINNAIAPVALYTESLLETEPELSARARDYLLTIQRAIEDVGQTVGRMREFYRQKEPQLTLLPVDINALLREVLNLTRARWSDIPQQRGLVIKTVLALAPQAPTVLGMASELREALINLIFNAVDAMPSGGTLTLRTFVAGSQPLATRRLLRLAVEVSDTGTGMDADTRRRCLEPFFTTKGERGTGLGLAMVYGIAQRHGADIDITSAPDQGTTVRLTFVVPAIIPAESSASQQEHPRPSRLRILVVDDDPLLLKSLRDTLEGDAHVVDTANGGQAGLDMFKQARQTGTPYTVVITDLGMPYVDGRQVASAIKELDPFTPVIMLTGWGKRLIDDADVPLSVDRMLSKPPKLSDLRLALAELTARFSH